MQKDIDFQKKDVIEGGGLSFLVKRDMSRNCPRTRVVSIVFPSKILIHGDEVSTPSILYSLTKDLRDKSCPFFGRCSSRTGELGLGLLICLFCEFYSKENRNEKNKDLIQALLWNRLSDSSVKKLVDEEKFLIQQGIIHPSSDGIAKDKVRNIFERLKIRQSNFVLADGSFSVSRGGELVYEVAESRCLLRGKKVGVFELDNGKLKPRTIFSSNGRHDLEADNPEYGSVLEYAIESFIEEGFGKTVSRVSPECTLEIGGFHFSDIELSRFAANVIVEKITNEFPGLDIAIKEIDRAKKEEDKKMSERSTEIKKVYSEICADYKAKQGIIEGYLGEEKTEAELGAKVRSYVLYVDDSSSVSETFKLHDLYIDIAICLAFELHKQLEGIYPKECEISLREIIDETTEEERVLSSTNKDAQDTLVKVNRLLEMIQKRLSRLKKKTSRASSEDRDLEGAVKALADFCQKIDQGQKKSVRRGIYHTGRFRQKKYELSSTPIALFTARCMALILLRTFPDIELRHKDKNSGNFYKLEIIGGGAGEKKRIRDVVAKYFKRIQEVAVEDIPEPTLPARAEESKGGVQNGRNNGEVRIKISLTKDGQELPTNILSNLIARFLPDIGELISTKEESDQVELCLRINIPLGIKV